jgi:hypothetical protein
MRLGDVAKAVGEEAATVAAELGLEGDHHMKGVDDAVANAYIEAKRAEQEKDTADEVARQEAGPSLELAVARSKRVRFWCESRRKVIPGDAGKREDIKFVDWIYECERGSAEDKLLSTPDVQARTRISEIVEEPYDDPMQVSGFITYLRGVCYPSPHEPNVPSREGRNCVRALLKDEWVDHLPSSAKSVPIPLIREVAKRISLKGKTFELTGE